MLFQEEVPDALRIIPFMELPMWLHMIVFVGVVGVGGSIIVALIFPRLITPLFIKLKNKILFRYKNAYLEKTNVALTPKRFIIRGIYIFLLVLGLLAFIIPAIDPSQWMNEVSYESFINEGVDPRYGVTVLITWIGILLPIVIGLWSIGWSMEDAGLMHYKFDERVGYELYEIEPIKNKYSSYLKGYAGITSILFFIEMIIVFAEHGSGRYSDMTMVILIPAISILLSIPAYYLYVKIGGNHKYLRKNLPELNTLTETDAVKR